MAAYENGINLDKLPMKYWSDKTKISFLQRRVIVYSLMYYELNESCISDKAFDAISKQLLTLQNASERADLEASDYYYVFYDFDASTGFYIRSRLNQHDEEYLMNMAQHILERWRKNTKLEERRVNVNAGVKRP